MTMSKQLCRRQIEQIQICCVPLGSPSHSSSSYQFCGLHARTFPRLRWHEICAITGDGARGARMIAGGIIASRPLCQRHELAGRGRCVSIFLDKDRRYIGKYQSKLPPKRTQRPPHRCNAVGSTIPSEGVRRRAA
jgi:hypothetical protein